MLDPQARAFLDRIAVVGSLPTDMSADDLRLFFEEIFTRLGGPGVAVGNVADVQAPGPHGPIPIRIYTPQGAPDRPLPLIVYYHGGGYVCGSRDSYDAVCRLLTRESGCVLASVDYRRAPEFPAPGPLEDAYAAFEWLAQHAGDFGADASRLAVAGDSAGGGLAAGVALQARDLGGPRLAHQLLVYPAVGYSKDTPSTEAYGTGHYLTNERIAFYSRCHVPDPERAKSLPYLLPLYAASLGGLPPATIIMAECDPLYDDGVAYAEQLRAAGVPVELRVYAGMIHAFFSFVALFDKGREAVTYAGTTVGAALKG